MNGLESSPITTHFMHPLYATIIILGKTCLSMLALTSSAEWTNSNSNAYFIHVDDPIKYTIMTLNN